MARLEPLALKVLPVLKQQFKTWAAVNQRADLEEASHDGSVACPETFGLRHDGFLLERDERDILSAGRPRGGAFREERLESFATLVR